MYICRSKREANELQTGCMDNSIDNLLIRKKLEVRVVPPKASKIIKVTWSLPEPYWITINTDGASQRYPSLASGCGIFQNSRGFVKGYFAISLGTCFAFEAEFI